MAENTTTQARFNSFKAFLACADLLLASGNSTDDHVQGLRQNLQSFLMGLEFGVPTDGDPDGDRDQPNYRGARRLAMPKDFFAGNKKSVVVVSQHLFIGYCECLYLREELGEVKFGKLLEAHGLQASSPLELKWQCTGAPPVGKIEASPCTNTNHEDDLYATMVGGNQPNHPLYGIFCCNTCHRKMERRELHLLQEAASLNVKETERLHILQERQLAHREHSNAARAIKVENEGLHAVQTEELTRNRARNAQKTEQHEKDPAARAEASKRNREAEQNRLDMGRPKKAPGVTRKLKAKKLYRPFFMDMLTQATRIWAREYGQPFVFWNHLVALFDHLLIDSGKKLGGVEFASNGKPKYLDHAYRVAVGKVLDQHSTVHWKVRDYVKNSATNDQKVEVLIPKVLQLLDQGMKSESENHHSHENSQK
jgi:hypothetical protein